MQSTNQRPSFYFPKCFDILSILCKFIRIESLFTHTCKRLTCWVHFHTHMQKVDMLVHFHTHMQKVDMLSPFTHACKRMTSSKIWGTYYLIPSTRAALRWSGRAKEGIPRINKGPRMKAALVNQLSPRLFPVSIPQQDCTNLQSLERKLELFFSFGISKARQFSKLSEQTDSLSLIGKQAIV